MNEPLLYGVYSINRLHIHNDPSSSNNSDEGAIIDSGAGINIATHGNNLTHIEHDQFLI